MLNSLTVTKGDMYLKQFIKDVLDHGSYDQEPRPKYVDGTTAHTYSINHVFKTYDISKGESPLITLRPIALKSAIGELLWIYQDQSNDLNLLKEKYGVTWWDNWDIGDRTIGSCYGYTVKRHNLINNLLDGLKNNPDGRRHIMELWQEDDFKEPHGLKPCYHETNFSVRYEGDTTYLDMLLVSRSSDHLTAGCINEMQYLILQYLVARHVGMEVGRFSVIITNCQIYDRHIENAKIMLDRQPIPCNPVIFLNPEKKNFFDFTVDDIKILYVPRDLIKEKNKQLKFELGI